MPELPDVERFRMYLDATSLHQEVSAVKVHDADVLREVPAQKFRSALGGGSFEATSRHGKFLFVHLESSPLLVLHFGMTGYLDYAADDRRLPQHTRVVFHFVGGHRLAYVCQRKLGRVTLAEKREGFIAQHHLGPDALDGHFTLEAFARRLAGRRSVAKSALMDQSILAGVGNIYADEILYQAGIAPNRRVSDMDKTDLRDLYRAMRRVLKTAIRNKAEISRLPRTYLLRRRDADGQCPRCGYELKTARIAGRGTYFCSRCQT